MVQVVIQVRYNLDLSLNDLLEHPKDIFIYFLKPSFNSKQPILNLLLTLVIDKSLQTHPQGNTRYDLQDDTSEWPDIYHPWLLVVVQVLQESLMVIQWVLVEDVVEDFGAHIPL